MSLLAVAACFLLVETAAIVTHFRGQAVGAPQISASFEAVADVVDALTPINRTFHLISRPSDAEALNGHLLIVFPSATWSASELLAHVASSLACTPNSGAGYDINPSQTQCLRLKLWDRRLELCSVFDGILDSVVLSKHDLGISFAASSGCNNIPVSALLRPTAECVAQSALRAAGLAWRPVVPSEAWTTNGDLYASWIASYLRSRYSFRDDTATAAGSIVMQRVLRGLPSPACSGSASGDLSPGHWISSLALASDNVRSADDLYDRLIHDLRALKPTSKDLQLQVPPASAADADRCVTPTVVRSMMVAYKKWCPTYPRPTPAQAENLVGLSGQLFRAAVLADVDVRSCPLPLDRISGYNLSGHLHSCIPAYGHVCEPAEVWRAGDNSLIPYWFHVSQAAAMGLMGDARVQEYMRALLRYGLFRRTHSVMGILSDVEDGIGYRATSAAPPSSSSFSSSPWHPTGWPAVGTPAERMIVTPQNMFYFASSYFFVELEAEFKSQMHARIGWTLPRISSLAYDAATRSASMPRFSLYQGEDKGTGNGLHTINGTSQCSLHILVISSFWDTGHSSHRITAPLIHSLQQKACLYLLYARKVGKVHADTSGFKQVLSHSLLDSDLAGAYALHLNIKEAGFDAVLFPSIGMSPVDMVLSSFRSAPLQIVTYGHSASTHSPVIDAFLGGSEPEVLGPVSSPIHALDIDCSPVLEAMASSLRSEMRRIRAGFINIDGGNGSRWPMTSETDTDGSNEHHSDNLHPSTIAPGLCRTIFDEHQHGAESSEHCDTNVSAFSKQLRHHLLDAQNRYSEKLLLLPGLGLWFTNAFPSIASEILATHNASRLISDAGAGNASLGSLVHASHAWARLARDASVGADHFADGLATEIEVRDAIAATSWRGSASAPVRIALVWSLVKWNAGHLQRVLRVIHAAQAHFERAWHACNWTVGDTLDTSQPQHTRIEAAMCDQLLASYLEPVLHIHLVPFINLDMTDDPLEALAVITQLRRLIEPQFDDGSVVVEPVTGAETPQEYYTHLSQVDVAIDNQPFAACNTMQDLLALSIPIVSMSHDGEFEPGTTTPLRWRSTIGSSILTKVGLTGLVAINEAEFYSKNAALISSPVLRAAWRWRMQNSDWRTALMNQGAADADAETVLRMVIQHSAT